MNRMLRENVLQESNSTSSFRLSPALLLAVLAATAPLHAERAPASSPRHSWQPVASSQIEPLTDSDTTSTSSLTTTSTRPANRTWQLPAVDTATYQRFKQAARQVEAGTSDSTLEMGSSLAERGLSTSHPGLDYFSASSSSVVPDMTLGTGSNRVLEAANSALRISNQDGSQATTVSLQSFFGQAAGTFLFAPRVIFDRNAENPRYYIAAAQPNLSTPSRQASYIHLAVSRSADPADLSPANWCRYRLDTLVDATTEDASWADHPNLGTGADALLISSNQRRYTNYSFTWNVVRAINKLALSDNAAGCPTVQIYTFIPAKAIGDFTTFNLQPVQHATNPSSFVGATNPAYLVNDRYLSSNIYRVWRVRNVAAGNPVLDAADVAGSFTYNFPPDAEQAGSSTMLDTGDTRVTSAAGIGDALWATHTTSCTNGSTTQSCVRVVRFLVGQGSGGGMTASLAQETTFAGSVGTAFWAPAIAADESETTVVSFQNSSVASFLSASYSSKDLTESGYTHVGTIANGTCPAGEGTSETAAAQADPDQSGSFWVAGGRYTMVNSMCTWQDWVANVSP